MRRAKHSLSHYRLHTADMGELIPIACVPVLPGDTFQHSTAALIRVTPLNTPVMHPVAVRIHHFFVPNRLTWPADENGGWEAFITGGPDGNNAESPPTVNTTNGRKSVLAYLGHRPTPSARPANAMSLRAYNMIYNEYYRDQDLITERAEDDNTLARIAWEKDYFTTARPWTQKGSEVTLPVGSQAPIKTDADEGEWPGIVANASGTEKNRSLGIDGALVDISTSGGTDLMYADLSEAGVINVNDFREAFAMQRYQEARARYGSRFTEYLRYLNIRPSDARLQRPEYLGGGTSRLNFSEVLQTSPNEPGVDQNGIGDLFGHGIAGVRSNAYRKFFEEHGYVISLMSVRPKSIYLNGAHREWRKTTKEDYYQKELVHLGQQAIYEYELDGSATLPNVEWGYQDRYDEYRSHPSFIGQDFRDTLNSWHLGRELSAPTLNGSFVECAPSDRIYQTTTEDPLWIMVNHSLVARRLVPKKANPRII